LDLLKFGQMFLNGGSLGDVRVISPATVKAMMRDHAKGLKDRDRDKPERGFRGLGWDFPGTKQDLMYANLYSPSTVSHSGAGGALIWVDPGYEIVGVCLTVELTSRDDGQRTWAADRFANAVTAAIEVP
jgi:CubicO group peptidase (beta-lactamase class C family)